MHPPRRRTDALTVVFFLCSTVFLGECCVFGDAFTDAHRGRNCVHEAGFMFVCLHCCWLNTAVCPLFDPAVVLVSRVEIVVEFALPIVFTLSRQSTVRLECHASGNTKHGPRHKPQHTEGRFVGAASGNYCPLQSHRCTKTVLVILEHSKNVPLPLKKR